MYGVLNHVSRYILFQHGIGTQKLYGNFFFLLDINKCVWDPELNVWCIIASY